VNTLSNAINDLFSHGLGSAEPFPFGNYRESAVPRKGCGSCECGGTNMPMYKDTVLTLDRQRRPRLARADGRRMTAADTRDDGASIFCAISLALMIVALWAAASGQADVSAAMF
jgi:hypothetical protein